MERKPVDARAEELFRTLYERAAAEPKTWFFSAQSLRRAAEGLLPLVEQDLIEAFDETKPELKPPVCQVYMLLCGLALEVFVKGICVAKNPKVVKDNRFVGPRNHKLLDLFASAKIDLSDQERELVERLEHFVLWAGRYPIPLNLREYLPRTQPNGGSGPDGHFSSRDPDLLKELMDRTEAALQSARESASV